MNKELFIEELKKIDVIVNEEQLTKLDKYYNLLVEWNERINLTRIIDEDEVYLKHFYDSLTLDRVVKLKSDITLCDIGTGAGFPGIVLKIVFPNLKITLVDSLLKRVNFLNLVIKELDLKDIVAIHERGEVFASNNREKYDLVTSRAVMNLSMLAEISIPLLKVNGLLVAMKGIIDEELRDSFDIIKKLDSNIELIDKFLLPVENSNRSLIMIKKNAKTNVKYPRSFDKMKKNIVK